MTGELSFFHLITNASLLVQGVMLILMGLSVVSWTLIFQRNALFKKTRKLTQQFEEQFWSGGDLGKLFEQLSNRRDELYGMEAIFRSGFKEFIRLRAQPDIDPRAVMDGCIRAMRVSLAHEQERLEQHLAFLASVGSTSPYVGLFGTVWGIMSSFQALGSVQQATLQMVAPGISEALIATAMGLFAAIPAVLAYNRFATTVQGVLNRYNTFVDEFSTILHRKVYAPNK